MKQGLSLSIIVLLFLVDIMLGTLIIYWFNNKHDIPISDEAIKPTQIASVIVSPLPSEIISITPIPTNNLVTCTNECTDCILYPINKANGLRTDYIPNTENLSLSGGGSLVNIAATKLNELFIIASEQDINLKAVSSYRSFQTQVALFESYVQKEIARNNVDRAMAEEIANIYSAKPGHSEHQLGTTVDLTCNGCTPFINDTANNKVYDFLQKNTYKYGFVISYSEQNKQLTGYKAEPWHIRYIGEELAKQYYSKYNELEGNYSLDKFLEHNCSK